MAESKRKPLNKQWVLSKQSRIRFEGALSASKGVSSAEELWRMVLPSKACQDIAQWAAKETLRLHHRKDDGFLQYDLRQEILLYVSKTFHRKDCEVDWNSSPALWLAQCLINAGFDTMRKKAFRRPVNTVTTVNDIEMPSTALRDESREDLVSIKLAITKLTLLEQTAIEMRHFTDPRPTLEAIGHQLEELDAGVERWPVSKMHRLLTGAYNKLRASLGGSDYE